MVTHWHVYLRTKVGRRWDVQEASNHILLSRQKIHGFAEIVVYSIRWFAMASFTYIEVYEIMPIENSRYQNDRAAQKK
jgi:hypothetical protein